MYRIINAPKWSTVDVSCQTDLWRSEVAFGGGERLGERLVRPVVGGGVRFVACSRVSRDRCSGFGDRGVAPCTRPKGR